MAIDTSVWEPVAKTDLSDWEPVSPKNSALLATRDKLAKQGDNIGKVTSAIGTAEKLVEPYTPSGMLNQPSRLIGQPDAFQPNKPIVNVPEPTGTGFLAGIGKLGAETLSGLTTPENLVTAPAAVSSAVVRAVFAGQMVKDLPEDARNAVNVLSDPKATTAQKTVAIGNPIVKAVMATALSAAHEKAGPQQPKEVAPPVMGDALKTPEGAKPPVMPPVDTGKDVDALLPSKEQVTAPTVAKPAAVEPPPVPEKAPSISEKDKAAIPLGVMRQGVINPDLQKLSEDDFDRHFLEAKKSVYNAEKSWDDGKIDPENNLEHRQQLAATQDAWTAADNERFRRNNLDVGNEDIFRHMIDLADIGHDRAKFGILADIVKSRGNAKPGQVTSVYSELPDSIKGNPDFREALGGKLGKFKEWLEDYSKQKTSEPPVTPAEKPQIPPSSPATAPAGGAKTASEGTGGEKAGEPVQKYRVGSNPTLHTLVEKLPATKVEIENGEQPVKVKNEKTGQVSTVLESDLTPVKQSATPKVRPEKVDLDEQLRDAGLDPSSFPDAKSKQAALKRQEAIKPRLGRGGPGAAASGEPGTYSPIQRMADELRVKAKLSQPIDNQISAIERGKLVLGDAKDAAGRAMANLVAVKDAIWEKLTSLPEYGDENRAVGKWFYALQKADAEARNFAKEIVKAVPSKLRREAITNWIQAEGDEALLKDRASKSNGSIRKGYEIAQNLSDHEKEIASMLRDYYDVQLQEGISADILKSGLDNYITQVWKKENPITKRLVNDLALGKLTPNFKYARKRIFDSYFDGEQLGYTPNKDAGFLVANYDQAFNKSIAARAFIRDLHEGKASDGRPLVEISGYGKTIGEDDGKPAILIQPHAKPEEMQDYKTIDHPALRGWKWVEKTPEGTPILQKGNMLVHPEAYQRLKNRLSNSAFRQNPVTRAVLNVQSGVKQTMLSLSGFHQVQETLHALGHRVNPANLPEMDFSEPVTKALAEHGLQLADYDALSSFSEGLTGGNLTNKLPWIGPKMHAYQEWLFQDYIPRLKLQMAKLTLERNQERYPDLPQDKLLELTANQANHAFGELPYRYWGSSPTLRDALRMFILAPDFLQSRAGFVAHSVLPYGREQLVALGLLAATQFIIARIVNQIVDKNPHFEKANWFRIVLNGHAYGLRTIPGDIMHLMTDPRSFSYNRMSPALRTAFTAISGRDEKGVKRDALEQVKIMAGSGIPLSLRAKKGQSYWDEFLNSFGVQNQRWDATQTIAQKVDDFKKKNGIKDPYEVIYDQEDDKFAGLRLALQNGNKKEAQAQFNKLASQLPPKVEGRRTLSPAEQIRQHFKASFERSLTGSKANDDKFYNSLDANGKREYKEAVDTKKAWYQALSQLDGAAGDPVPAGVKKLLR